ncbi:hypothetical protein CEXT_691261 [Caerostris extrusa]|uniref:Uncharacterized protein n=1 Tax=Caerostris extrusa TaxID=172846 RepID=A0AAV4XP22_CAEEX|nr:hypothetical protein CEXT_691261 [Caerostris extrusa]
MLHIDVGDVVLPWNSRSPETTNNQHVGDNHDSHGQKEQGHSDERVIELLHGVTSHADSGHRIPLLHPGPVVIASGLQEILPLKIHTRH